MKKSTFLDLPGLNFAFMTLVFLSMSSLYSQFPEFPPGDVTSNQDRDQMAWQLGITFPLLAGKLEDPNAPPRAFPSDTGNPEGNWSDSLGTGNTITRSSWGLWNNYSDRWYGFHPGPDSARLDDYPPIDLLLMNDGVTAIITAEDWWNVRRSEIWKDVTEQMWGVIPDDSILPAVTWSVVTTTGGSGAFAYIESTITGTIDISRYPGVRNRPVISATLRIPASAAESVPVMVVIGGPVSIYWNHTSPQGWGVCTFNPWALQPDDGTGLTSYLIGLCNKGNWRKPTDWGSLAAWSWGISKLIDYFETDTLVDATRIGVTGHSRFGKTALVAMAYEPRLFIAFPSDAGSLGTKMNRRHYRQDLENSVWDREYHWMAGNFMKWCGEKIPGQYLPRKIEDCPVDAHSLLALCAPRPVFINSGTKSTWCDPYGMYLTTVEATPVYKLLGQQGIVMNDPKPVVDKAYIEGNLAYRYHEGGHTDATDWPAFWQFAAKYIKTPAHQF